MLFTGEFEHAIDAKGRLAIPATIRNRMKPDEDGNAMYLTLGPRKQLRMYPERGFERLASMIEQGLVTEASVAEFDEIFFPSARLLEIDAVGRVLVPEDMLKEAGVGRQVVLIGLRDHLGIRNAEEWRASAASRLARQDDIFDRFARRRSGGSG